MPKTASLSWSKLEFSQSRNFLLQPPPRRFIRYLILLNLAVCVSFTDSVNSYITFAFPFKLLFFLKLLIICLVILSSPSLICSSSRRRASKCLVIQPPLLHFCHFAASIRAFFACLCSVSDRREMLQKQKIPKEKSHLYLFWLFNLKMIDFRFFKSKEATSHQEMHVLNIFIISALTLNLSSLKKSMHPSRSCVPDRLR